MRRGDAMRDLDPKNLWDQLVASLRGWMDEEEEDEEQASDPGLVFHLTLTIPIVIGILMMVRQ